MSPAYLDVWLFNGSGKPQCKELMNHVAGGPTEPSLGRHTVLMLQEHHQRALDWSLWQEQAARQRWWLRGAAATPGEGGGASAGVALAAITGRTPLAPLPGHAFDASPPASPGRLVAAWADMRHCPGGGLLFLSIYLWTNESVWSPRNAGLLEAAGTLIRRHGGLWILGGDWQSTPEDVRASGWPAQLGGGVHAAAQPTCSSGRVALSTSS